MIAHRAKKRRVGRSLRALLLCLSLVAALAPAGASALNRPPRIRGAFYRTFPRLVQGNSVAVAPDGIPWFGIDNEGGPPALAYLRSGELKVAPLNVDAERGVTDAVHFDADGDLWFGQIAGLANGRSRVAVGRRAPDGEVSEFRLAGEAPVSGLAVGTNGEIWFTRDFYGTSAKVGRIAATGEVIEIPLERESTPGSIVEGPDGAMWFIEAAAGQIGRVATDGEVQLFAAGPGVRPRDIVAGPDGALWFGENAEPRPHRRLGGRIGRITTGGEVTQFRVPSESGTRALAVDPRGFIRFATDQSEVASIDPSGRTGVRGCLNFCGASAIEALAVTPGGALWFARGSERCIACGGGSALLTGEEGTQVGKVPAGKPAPPRPLP